MIIDHTHELYKSKRAIMGGGKYNGAYYYSCEIVDRIIPNVKTDRDWVTVNIGTASDGCIFFIHNNLHPENYEYLSKYKDVILVCGVRETMSKVSHIGKAIYLPLSINVEEVEQYKTEKTKGTAFAGRRAKMKQGDIPSDVDVLAGLERTDLLTEMAKYERVYAVGRTAIEAKALGCKVLPYDKRYPSTTRWRVRDNLEAAKILQEKLDKIDGKDIRKEVL